MISYKCQLIFSSTKEEDNILEFLNESSKVINRCFELLYQYKDKNLSLKETHNICYNKVRKEFPNLPAQTIIKSYKEAKAIYKSIKSNKHKIDKPPVRKSPKLNLDKRLYSNFTSLGIWLTNPFTKNKRLKVSFMLYPKLIKMFNKYETGDPSLIIKNNKVYLNIPFKTPEIILSNLETIGYDLGAKRLAVSSTGIVLDDKEYKKNKRKIRYLKRCLQSKGTKSAKRKLKKIKNKEKNISNNFNHCLANKMLNCKEAIIVLEDLSNLKQNVKKFKNSNIKNTKNNNKLNQISFYKLKEILSYKALLIGKQVVTVSPSYTSQNDCRGIEQGIRKGRRYYTSDKLVFDSDWNAAINIKQRYKKTPLSVLPLDGKLIKQAVLSSSQS